MLLVGVLACGLAASAVAAGVPGFVAAALWASVLFCRAAYVRQHVMAANGRPIWYYLATGIFPYLVAFACAATLLVAWREFLRLRGDDLSLETLIMLESRAEGFANFFAEYVKPDEISIALILFVLLVLSHAVRIESDRQFLGDASNDPSIRGLDGAQRAVAVYARHTGPVAAFLAVLASVTLLGNELGRSANDLDLRIKTVRSGYAVLAERTQTLLTERVTASVYAKVVDTLPPDYQEAMALPPAIDEAHADLERHTADARRQHAVSSVEVEQLLRDESRRRASSNGVRQHVTVGGASGAQEVPTQLTRADVDRAGSGATAPRAEPIDLVKDAHRAYTLQVEKVVTERIGQALKPLCQAFPIMEPVVNALIDSVDQAFQERLGRAYDRLMHVAVARPDTFAGELDREARTVVDRMDVRPAAQRAAELGEPHAAELRRRLDALKAGPALVDAAVNEELRRRAARQKAAPGKIWIIPRPSVPYPYLAPRPPVYPGPSVDRWQPRYTPPKPPVAPRPPPRGRLW